MKTGVLNRVEKFYIEQNPDGKTAEEIAVELDRSVKIVRKHMIQAEKAEKKPTTTTPKRTPLIDSLIVKKERNGQVVSTAMSQAASEYTDSQRPRYKEGKKNANIHKPKG